MNLQASNIVNVIAKREWNLEYGSVAERALHVTESMVKRLGLRTELEGHNGCVNCLEWNAAGSLLASGSDDSQVILWDPYHQKMLQSVPTGHNGNIFSVKFMPERDDRVVATCAADAQVKVLDLPYGEVLHQCTCHQNRVKRLAVAPHLPYLVWSAGEDGLVMQLDLRVGHQCRPAGGGGSVLVNLERLVGPGTEAKCVTVCPTRPDLLAVGANDPFVRVYDRRMVRLSAVPARRGLRDACGASADDDEMLVSGTVQYFCPGHLSRPGVETSDRRRRHRSLAVTYVSYSADGRHLVANLGSEQVYLFDTGHPRTADMFDTSLLARPPSAESEESSSTGPPLPPRLEALRQEANRCHQQQQYSAAVQLNSRAIRLRDDVPTFYSNRAAAYMKRGWNGDVYAALRDCQTTLRLQPSHVKAAFRLCWCLLELGHVPAAAEALAAFRRRHPQQASSFAVLKLERDLKEAQFHQNGSVASEGSLRASRVEAMFKLESQFEQPLSPPPEQEQCLRRLAADYENRYCGHCNTTTDIKEANFFGRDGQFILAGSDDGTFFVWERQTSAIVRVLRGDATIVNCVQPHPRLCLLATSGIDSCVRLWAPAPLDDAAAGKDSVEDTELAAQANQQRMNADPMDMMLLNFSGRGGDESAAQGIPCRTS